MIGMYEAIRDRLAGLDVLQAVDTGMSPDAVEIFAVGQAVSALVCPLVETAAEIREAGMRVSQKVTERFGVVLCLSYPAGFPEMEPAKEAIKASLRGWEPEGKSEPIVYRGGKTLVYDVSDDGGGWRYLLEFSVPQQDVIDHQP